MKIVTCQMMRELDKKAVEIYHIPSILLMEQAARGIVWALCKTLGDICDKKVLFVCGDGKNGGDGFAAARLFTQAGGKSSVLFVGEEERLKEDTLTNYKMIESHEIPLATHLKAYSSFECVVDCIYGTGFHGELPLNTKMVIEQINRTAKYIISADMPSGMEGDTGRADGSVRANQTVTFGLPKVGLLSDIALDKVGEMTVWDIGFPKELVEGLSTDISLIDKVHMRFPQRLRNLNKGACGKVLLIAGSENMSGPAILSANAAMRSGCGLVTIATPHSVQKTVALGAVECVTVPLQEEHGMLSIEALPTLMERANKADVLLFGNGLGNVPSVSMIAKELIQAVECPVVLDADGINAILPHIDSLRDTKFPVILTPHAGEMARLTGKTIDEVQENRFTIAKEFAVKYRVICVLKGAKTIIALPNGKIFVNPTGNSGMATAGMGDVLAGMVAGLLAQGIDSAQAVSKAVYIHGLAGDRVKEEKGEYGLMANDVVCMIPQAIKQLMEK